MRSVSFSIFLLLLAALHIALAPAERAAAQAPDPLTLTLTAERSGCTAGTLTPVTWEIKGGTPPYTLTVAGETVDPDAESVNVTCGALPEPAPGGTPLTEAPGTIPATVTDATGAPATASAAYTIVPPLPAPTGLAHDALRTDILVRWEDVPVAASAPSATPDCPCPLYLLRWRPAGTGAWTTVLQPVTMHSRPGDAHDIFAGLREGTAYTWAVAALREAIEQETPTALTWSAPLTATTVAPPTGVRATATHDTITVNWNPQPAAEYFSVSIWGAHGSTSQAFTPDGDAPHQVVFRHLAPDTEYTVQVGVPAPYDSPRTETTVSTTAPPAGWTPLPRGPTNLRATATHDSITVFWDPPFPDAEPGWAVMVFAPNGYRIAIGWPGDPPPSGWTTRGDFVGLEPETTYRVIVAHDGGDGASAEITITTNAAPPPLRLTLTAGRAECTAGTLNPVSWEIRGGVGPYRLTVDGALVDAEAEGANATCGALPDYGIWLPVTQAPGTITATVTDATGAPATASAAYTIVAPLPAPTELRHVSYPGFVYARWSDVPGVGKVTLEDDDGRPYTLDAYLVRYREVGATEWIHVLRTRTVRDVWEVFDSGIREFSVASLRHPLERRTPDALRWSAAHRYAPVQAPQNVVATATHDTVTVSWDGQPLGAVGKVRLHTGTGDITKSFPLATSTGRESVTFGRLPPSTTFQVHVEYETAGSPDGFTSTEVVTLPPPPDYEPPPAGPKDIRVSATHNTITVSWRASREDSAYVVDVYPAGTSARAHIADLPPGTTTVTADGNALPIQPDTLYEVVVFELGIPSVTERVMIRTALSPAQSAPPLTMILTAERSECTAGTLNPVTWTITGGTAPYTLTVAGETVDADAESAAVTCGALPAGASQAPGTVTAVVMDAAGARATASAAYTIVPPLPAPAGLEAHALRTHMLVRWGDVPVPASAPSATPDCPCPLYLLRWRVADTDAWTTRLQPVTRDSRPGDGYELLTDLSEGTTYELAVATLRDAIEQDTPTALTWSPTVTETTIAPATRVRAVATHDTITVTWDPQPAASYFSIGLRRVGGGVSQRFTPDGATPHQVVFRHLPPKEQYTVRLGVPAGYQSPVTEVTVSTTAPPAAWTPLPRGPQNLRTAVTHNSVTVNWDAPYAGANDVYTVSLFRAGEEVGFTIVSGNEGTSHVFTGMVPSTRYRVKVTHAGIVMDDAEVSVTTLATPTAAQSTGPVETCYAPMPIALPEILICQPAVTRSLYR